MEKQNCNCAMYYNLNLICAAQTQLFNVLTLKDDCDAKKCAILSQQNELAEFITSRSLSIYYLVMLYRANAQFSC